MTFVDVQNFVPHFWNMETKRISVTQIFFASNFGFGQPTAVRKRKFHFVSVKKLLFRTQDRFKFRKFNFANSLQMIFYLILFEDQLLAVFHILPFASTANTKVLANWIYAML